MKAVDFIRKFGWEKVRDGIRNIKPYEEYLIGIYNSDPKEIEGVVYIDRTPCKANVDDLKIYVDAWDLVDRVGNIVECKRPLSMLERSNIQHMTIGDELNGRRMEQRVLTADFKKAIELVESVNERN